MIYSMTAFARTQNQGDWGSLVCEVRSINHRYLEASFHIPDFLRALEMNMRETLRNSVRRGKVECLIRYQPAANAVNACFKVNTKLAQQLSMAAEQISSFVKHPAPISATDILRFPGVQETAELDVQELKPQVMNVFETTLKELVSVRGREGEELKQLFLQRMDIIEKELASVKERAPQVIVEQNERIRKRFADLKLDLDANRLEQEMLLYSQRIDVMEEIERIATHVTEIRRILKNGGTVGRRLDFLMQELNREANTLGSKSVDSQMTHAAVEMKVLIEQVREQVQNIE